jgi:hypothetical protein
MSYLKVVVMPALVFDVAFPFGSMATLEGLGDDETPDKGGTDCLGLAIEGAAVNRRATTARPAKVRLRESIVALL